MNLHLRVWALTGEVRLEASFAHELGHDVDRLSSGAHGQQLDELRVMEALQRLDLLHKLVLLRVLWRRRNNYQWIIRLSWLSFCALLLSCHPVHTFTYFTAMSVSFLYFSNCPFFYLPSFLVISWINNRPVHVPFEALASCCVSQSKHASRILYITYRVAFGSLFTLQISGQKNKNIPVMKAEL